MEIINCTEIFSQIFEKMMGDKYFYFGVFKFYRELVLMAKVDLVSSCQLTPGIWTWNEKVKINGKKFKYMLKSILGKKHISIENNTILCNFEAMISILEKGA